VSTVTSSAWRNLPVEVRRTAYHEAGHGVLGELLGWPVRYVRLFRGGGGVCMFKGKAPSAWIDLAVSAGGFAAEGWFGIPMPSVAGAQHDRQDGLAVMERAGLIGMNAAAAVLTVETQLWPVFADDGVDAAVKRVALALVKSERWHLGRAEFLRAADLNDLGAETVENVRRFCRRVVKDVQRKHL
jgi:hypothetical protein